MKRLVSGLGALLAAALLLLVDSAEPTGQPTFGPDFGGAAMVAPILLMAPELRP